MSALAAVAPLPLRPPRRRRLPPPDLAQGDEAWVAPLNRVASAVLATEGLAAWRDLERCWYDLRTLFGPRSALRLLNLAELAALVEA